MKRIWMLVLTIPFLFSACGAETGMEAHEAWTQPAAQGKNGAVYFAFHNHSSKADELIGASTEVAEAVKIEQSTMNGNVMQTNQVQSVPLKAFADIDFGPEGFYLMLVNLKKELKAGGEFQINLHFKNSKDIKIRVAVRETPPPGEGHSSASH